MRAFNEMTPQEGVEKLTLLLSRISLLSKIEPHEPLYTLTSLVEALNVGDISLAIREFHILLGQLLNCGSRRVSGDIFKDYLISLLIEQENVFSNMAAAGEIDRAVYSAMRRELFVFGELSRVSSAELSWFISERAKELRIKPNHTKDNISLMSTAVWSGGTMRTMSKTENAVVQNNAAPSVNSVLQDGEWPMFRYDEEPLITHYAADEALESIYIKLKKTSVWANLIDELYDLFATCGTGIFLKSRALAFSYGKLSPIKITSPLLPVSFYEAQRVLIMDNTIEFMRGEKAENICAYGGAGTGKTCMMQSLLTELPELRLIVLERSAFSEKYCCQTFTLINALSRQPLRFILLIDGIDVQNDDVKAFLRRFEFEGLVSNVLLYAAVRDDIDSALFGGKIYFPYPKPQEFCDMVNELISSDGMEADLDEVKNACLDERAVSHDCLSLTAAVRVANRCIGGR